MPNLTGILSDVQEASKPSASVSHLEERRPGKGRTSPSVTWHHLIPVIAGLIKPQKKPVLSLEASFIFLERDGCPVYISLCVLLPFPLAALIVMHVRNMPR